MSQPLALLALGSLAILVGGRMAEQIRQVGLLKAVGGTRHITEANACQRAQAERQGNAPAPGPLQGVRSGDIRPYRAKAAVRIRKQKEESPRSARSARATPDEGICA